MKQSRVSRLAQGVTKEKPDREKPEEQKEKEKARVVPEVHSEFTSESEIIGLLAPGG